MTDLHSQVTRAPARVGSPDREVATRGVGGRRRTWAGAALGAATGAAAYGVLAAGVVPAPLVVVVALALLLAVPTSPHLARRVALNGSVVLGWVCTTWWVRWPLPVNHGALVVAAAAAGLVWFVGCSSDPGRRLRRLRPRFVAADALLPTAGLVALAAMWRWAFPGSPQHALAAMLPGIDNVAHFHMFSTMRSYGATTQALGASPDGSRWAFDMYPQGFHAVAGTISELVRPHLPAGPEMLVAYTQAVAVVVVLGTVVLTAAIVSLPGLRRRPWVCLPVVSCTWTAFLWLPGQTVLADGFANFWLAAAAAGSGLVISLGAKRRLAVADVAAVGGLLVLVAHAWAPLAAIGAPAALALFHPLHPTLTDRRLRRRLWPAAAVLAAAAFCGLKALIGLFSDVGIATLVTSFGGIHVSNPLPVFVLLVLACYSCVAAPRIVRGAGATSRVEQQTAGRARVLLLAPAIGLTLTTALLVMQLRTLGTTSYYFLKFFVGFELILAAFVPALVGFLVVVSSRPGRHHRVRRVAAVTAAVLATQVFGAVAGTPALFDTGREGTAAVRPPYSAARMAQGIVAAARSSAAADPFESDYLAIGRDGAVQAFYPNAWFHGVLASMSVRTANRVGVLRRHVDTVDQAVHAAGRLLREDPRLRLVVPSATARALRAGLQDPSLASRVASVEAQGER
jgi:hypothetical protein